METTTEPKYIGPNLVINIEEENFQTPSGGKVFKVTYESGRSELIPEKAINLLLKDEPIDATARRDIVSGVLTDEIVKLLLEYNIAVIDLDDLVARVTGKVVDAVDRGSNFLWQKTDKDWVAGVNSTHRVTLLDADKVLKGILDDGTGSKQ